MKNGRYVIYVLITAAAVVWQPYLPAQTLDTSFRRHIFPQKLLSDCPDPFEVPVTDKVLSVGAFRLVVHPPDTRGSGPARIRVLPQNGAEFSIPLLFAGCKVWMADIDKNGKQDLVIATWEAANGPSIEVTLILNDAKNRPVPWHSPVADYEFENDGLENLVDLDGDGRAELLVPQFDGLDRIHARPGDRSIEVVTRYVISANGLKRVDGPVAGSFFPIVSPRNAKGVRVEDWSTYIDRGSRAVTIKSILPKCSKPMIHIGNPENYECRITMSDNTVLLGRPDIAIIDGTLSRRIEFSSPERIDQMVEEARVSGYQVRFTCKLRDTFCQPFLLWASPKQQ